MSIYPSTYYWYTNIAMVMMLVMMYISFPGNVSGVCLFVCFDPVHFNRCSREEALAYFADLVRPVTLYNYHFVKWYMQLGCLGSRFNCCTLTEY